MIVLIRFEFTIMTLIVIEFRPDNYRESSSKKIKKVKPQRAQSFSQRSQSAVYYRINFVNLCFSPLSPPE